MILGIFEYNELGRAEDPSFVIRTMVVAVAWPGATVREVEEQVVYNLEKKLQETPYLDYLRGAAAVPVEQHVGDVFAEHQGTYLGSAEGNRGLLALTTRMPGIELANAVQGYIRHHGARRAQVDALMHPLYANGQPAAVQLLLSME